MSDERRFAASEEIRGDIKVARFLLSPVGNPSNDEYMYNLAAYHAQQAVEKALKAYLRDVYGEDESKRTFKIHEMPELRRRLEDEYHHEVHPVIARNADLITSWEASSRYGHSLVRMRDKIETIIDAAECLAEDIWSQK